MPVAANIGTAMIAKIYVIRPSLFGVAHAQATIPLASRLSMLPLKYLPSVAR